MKMSQQLVSLAEHKEWKQETASLALVIESAQQHL